MDNFLQLYRNKSIKSNIYQYLLENVTIGCTLKYFLKYHGLFNHCIDRVELMVYQHDFVKYKDQMIQLQYKKCLKKVIFDQYFNEEFPVGFLPPCREIEFGEDFNQKLQIGSIQEGLETIQFPRVYSRALAEGVLPQGVKVVLFSFYPTGDHSSTSIENALPSSVERLSFYTNSLQLAACQNIQDLRIRNVNIAQVLWPPSLTRLECSIPPRSVVNWVPSTVLHLSMTETEYGENLEDSPVIELLPPNLVSLQLAGQFDAPFHSGLFPLSLESIDLTNSTFNQPLEGLLPVYLKKLILSYSFNHRIFPGDLPSSLEYLEFGYLFNQGNLSPIDHPNLFDQVFPQSLLSLRFGYDFEHELTVAMLPRSLTYLQVSRGSNHPIRSGVLPATLTRLKVHCSAPIEKNVLPPNLKILEFLDLFNQPLIPGSIPDSVEEIYIGGRLSTSRFHQSIEPGVIPPSVKKLYWYSSVFLHQRVKVSIPPTTDFKCFTQFNYGAPTAPLANFIYSSKIKYSIQIPKGFYSGESLKRLKFFNFNDTNYPLKQGDIPFGVEYLSLRDYTANPIKKGLIPSSVKVLALPNYSPTIFNNLPKSIKNIIVYRHLARYYDPEQEINQNLFEIDSIPSSVETLIIEAHPRINISDYYSGSERSVIYHVNQYVNDDKASYFDFIGN
ncbi:hypothetical protein CYY_002410 [Polysphondylium violaceum]|uniref:FNIP repeat-containing protein n=1 Tax=Polysphondylium violaceum TaxID=133409 RepID=A0A8J4PZF5_9MYCE|nr:hypothetical protein CYY_002410 [Polysphondylium violaceum]